jgi:SH3-like domain-containing protein
MRFVPVLFALVLLSSSAFATDAETEDTAKGASGLPIPRFASLRSNDVNMRTGPGTRYPIEWVYHRQGLPVEITAEFDYWRRIRDWEGSEGWVHKSALSGKRGLIVTGSMRELRTSEDEQAAIAAHLEPGATGMIVSCAKIWCRVKFDHAKGYLQKSAFWGVYPDETLR